MNQTNAAINFVPLEERRPVVNSSRLGIWCKRRPGRPVSSAIREADALLTRWGEETGGSLYSDAPGWIAETILGRLIRQGPGASAASRHIGELSGELAAVEIAVKSLPSRTRRVVVLWYASGDKFNRTTCMRRLRMPAMEMKWRLRYGREAVAEAVGLGE